MLIKLPSDCVQPDSNKAEYDVGTCKESVCAGPLSDQTLCADPERETYCCQPVETEIASLQCQGYTLPVRRAVSCGCRECAQLPSQVIGSIVSFDTNEVLQFVSVYYKNRNVALSDEKGTFTLEIPSQVSKASLTLKDEVFLRVVDTVKVVQLRSGFTTYCMIKMKPRPVPVSVDSTAETYLPVASDSDDAAFAEMVIEPNTMYDMNGDLLTDNVDISVNNIDMRNASNAEIAPGEFSFVDDNGDLQSLETFNLWSIDAKDKNGNPVSIGGSSTIMLDQEALPPCNFDENGFCDTKLWVLNTATGSWEVASELQATTGGGGNGRRRKRQGAFLVGNVDVSNGLWYNIDVSTDNSCYAKVLAYNSEELTSPIDGGYSVQATVTRDRGLFFQSNAGTANGVDGICVLVGCDNSGSYTARMTATYRNRFLIPVDSTQSSSNNFVLTATDVENLEYAIEEGPANTALRIKPNKMYTNERDGPLHPPSAMSDSASTCKASDINTKHLQFYLPESLSARRVTCTCNTVESAAKTVRSRKCMTFYNYLPEQKQEQRYCFIGIRVRTSYTNVRIIATSRIHDASRLKNFPVEFKDPYFFGSREVTANPDANNNIDVCMEFKCGDKLYTGPNNHGRDQTRVEIEVKGVRGHCRVTPSGAFNGHLNEKDKPKCHNSFTTPFCFIDPSTYGDIGIFKRENVATGTCTNDPNSPQNDNTDHCEAANGQFTPGLEITC